MTDLTKGIIEIEGFEIGPNITQEEFENNLGHKFSKHVNRYNENISTFYYNEFAGLRHAFDASKHVAFEIDGMFFENIVVDFQNEKIKCIQLISNLQTYDLDAEGKKTYSEAKIQDSFSRLKIWAIGIFGEANNKSNNANKWFCENIYISTSSYRDIAEGHPASLYFDYVKTVTT